MAENEQQIGQENLDRDGLIKKLNRSIESGDKRGSQKYLSLLAQVAPGLLEQVLWASVNDANKNAAAKRATKIERVIESAEYYAANDLDLYR